MKKFIILMLVAAFVFSLCGCKKTATDDAVVTSSAAPNLTEEAKDDKSNVDIDLTKLSGTMVYSTVNDMVTNPSQFIGKTVKMTGTFGVYQDSNTKKNYFACLFSDATSCCSQQIEFVLDGSYKFPDDYPTVQSQITVSGVFDTYQEGDYTYCQLIHAKLENT